ncbi:MAG TPA: EAL domain-containing protein [Acidimicrobiales bacterium]|nr:EAL domain-containing protein [Acidimicrobiales bacterium]
MNTFDEGVVSTTPWTLPFSRAWLVGGSLLGIAAIGVAVPEPGWVADLAAVLVPVAVAVVGIRGWYRTTAVLSSRGRTGWLLLGIASALVAVGSIAADHTSPTLADAATLAGWATCAAATLQLIGGRVRGRWIDAVVEALLVAAPIAYLAVAFALDQRPAAMSLTDGVMGIIALASGAVLVVVAMHLRDVHPRQQSTAHLVLLGAVALLALHLVRGGSMLAGADDVPVLDAVWTAAAALPALLWACATLGAECQEQPERIEALPTPLTHARLGVVALSVAVGPMVLAVRVATSRGGGITAYAAGAVAVAGVAVAYLVRMVEQRARVEHLALHDDLCDLPNRVLLGDRIESALAHAPRTGTSVALLFLDLDRFKTINDSLGHATGNDLLRAVAGRLTTHVRRGDTVARLGGDEFAILLPGLADTTAAATVAQHLLEAFQEPFDLAGRQIFVSPSIGVSLHPHDAADAEELLRNADAAMYRSKARGRNTFEVYTHELNERAQRTLTMESYLHKAVERDELVLHYQPKVELRTGQIVGMEALLRWQHPDLGLLPPGEFIPLAEETGLIVPLGEWALVEACTQTQRWMRAGHQPLTVAVNLSARQFQHQRVGDLVARALRASHLDPRALELELTESLALQDPDSIVATLADLKDIGVQCSIDDFGTGYSGLQYLTRFPIDKLKIDRFFISEISSGDNARIVSAVIALAHNLQLEVIAEGVETDEQLQFLVDNGCDEMQGFLFSRPVPPDDFEALLVDTPDIVGQVASERRLRVVRDRPPATALPDPAVAVRVHADARLGAALPRLTPGQASDGPGRR